MEWNKMAIQQSPCYPYKQITVLPNTKNYYKKTSKINQEKNYYPNFQICLHHVVQRFLADGKACIESQVMFPKARSILCHSKSTALGFCPCSWVKGTVTYSTNPKVNFMPVRQYFNK